MRSGRLQWSHTASARTTLPSIKYGEWMDWTIEQLSAQNVHFPPVYATGCLAARWAGFSCSFRKDESKWAVIDYTSIYSFCAITANCINVLAFLGLLRTSSLCTHEHVYLGGCQRGNFYVHPNMHVQDRDNIQNNTE